MIELLPEEYRQRLPELYTQEHEQDPNCPVRFYHPTTGWSWFPYEIARWGDSDDYIMFGWVNGFEGELGYFLLSELEENGVVLDRDYVPKTLSQVKSQRGGDEPTMILYIRL